MRIGKMPYLNNLPVYYHLLKQYSSSIKHYTIIEGPPRYLNRRIREGEIDVSVVSSIEYARNAENYLILPDLSISSEGQVRSVLLFSRVPLTELHQQTIFISSDSETSLALIKIIFSHHGVEPLYMRGNIPNPEEGSFGFDDEFAAMLVIGDLALQLNGRNPYPYKYDLGEEWQKITGLPFVFALWIVRKEIFARDREIVFRICRTLQESRNYSLGHLEELISFCGQTCSLPSSFCCDYLQNLRFELPSSYQQGLKMYFHFLYKLGEIPHSIQTFRFLGEVEC